MSGTSVAHSNRCRNTRFRSSGPPNFTAAGGGPFAGPELKLLMPTECHASRRLQMAPADMVVSCRKRRTARAWRSWGLATAELKILRPTDERRGFQRCRCPRTRRSVATSARINMHPKQVDNNCAMTSHSLVAEIQFRTGCGFGSLRHSFFRLRCARRFQQEPACK